MSDVTQILSKIEAGDPRAAAELLPLVYDELRKLAASRMSMERPDHTLQATALVHEAYLRLVGSDQPWTGRNHFFAAAANSMHQILVDWARSRQAAKHQRRYEPRPLEELPSLPTCDPDLILDLDDSLARLANVDAEAAELVKLRLFAGLSVSEAGQVLNLSRSTAYEIWQFARTWFSVRSLASDRQ